MAALTATRPIGDRATLTDAHERWFPGVPRPAGDRLRLICFSYAGGTVSVYRDWPAALGGDVLVVPVLRPGRGRRLHEQPYTAMAPLVTDVADALIGCGLATDYALFGHSMGALLAYEVACALRDRGAPGPRHLFVSGSKAPHLYGDAQRHTMSAPALLRMVRDLGGFGDLDATEVTGTYFDRRLPVLRADLQACDTYRWRPRAPLSCSMTAFRGADDPVATGEQVEAWRAYTSGSLLVRRLPGNHFYLDGEPGRQLLRDVRDELGRLPGAARPTLEQRRTS
jgi:surfactin synthase thioesterase subunit